MRSFLSLFFLMFGASLASDPVCMVSLINIVKFRELCVGILVAAWLLRSIKIHFADDVFFLIRCILLSSRDPVVKVVRILLDRIWVGLFNWLLFFGLSCWFAFVCFDLLDLLVLSLLAIPLLAVRCGSACVLFPCFYRFEAQICPFLLDFA